MNLLSIRQESKKKKKSFKGTIPETGIRTMSAVMSFSIYENSFEGALPGSGLQVMRAMSKLLIYTNSFKGTIPESGIRAMSAVTEFKISTNSVPTVISGIDSARTRYSLVPTQISEGKKPRHR
eukprot:6245513-Amphidinium_carterae.1